ncbi:MAG: CvpA family protein [Christensenellales bacterium]
MNIIDGILLFVLAISVIYGFYHGFIQSVTSLVALGLSVLSGFLFGPRAGTAIFKQPDHQRPHGQHDRRCGTGGRL